MKVFKFTIKNNDEWAITNLEVIVVADDKFDAIKLLQEAGYNLSDGKLIRLEEGVHLIVEAMTE
jgi:hypothetical protein